MIAKHIYGYPLSAIAIMPMSQQKSKPKRGFYKDRGCNKAPACLSCPLPVCKFDVPDKFDKGWNRKASNHG